MDDRAFWELASGAEDEDGETQALDVLAADRVRFVTSLRRLPAGEVVTLVVSDGTAIRGRLLDVGADFVRVGEVVDDLGAAARSHTVRVHDVRLEAVIRLVRGPEV